ncbi:MAG: molybdenum cofactor biosynthesis protein [Chloroflexota bacterium]
MEVTVRLFALQRRQLGTKALPLTLPDGATIADAWAALVAAHPVLAPAATSMRFARNAVYADPATPLADGDELALIPPVSGGSDAPAPYRRIALSDAPFTDDVLAELRRALATPADGAVVLFLGQTRATPGTPAPGEEAAAARFAGSAVLALEYEAFAPLVLATLHAIADEIAARFGVQRIAILHRVGEVPLGEASVVIGVASGHRGAGFDAARYAIEELKARAPIWKSERFADGSVWIGAPARTTALPEEPVP